MTEFTELEITGRVATPGDPDWDEIRPGWNLAADVTPGTVVRDGNAVTFDGTITSTNAYGGGGYIHAKVVDGGGATCGGDTIVVFVNEPAYDGIFANVTSGDLTVF